MAVIRDTRPDVVLMDIRMPDQDGLIATELLLARPDPPAVLVLTTFDADDMVLRALRLGADGFLLKDTPPPKMIEAVRAWRKGEPVLSPSVARQVIAAATGGTGPRRRRRARSWPGSPNASARWRSRWPGAARTPRSPSGCT